MASKVIHKGIFVLRTEEIPQYLCCNEIAIKIKGVTKFLELVDEFGVRNFHCFSHRLLSIRTETN
ncbi:hypothetical protein ABIE56_002875 [Luteibacter sp. 621]